MGHADTKEFSEEDFGDLSGFDVKRSDREVRVTGVCPRCDGATTFVIRRGIVKGLRRGAPKPTTVFCSCGKPHTGRPEDAPDPGCGARWKVTL